MGIEGCWLDVTTASITQGSFDYGRLGLVRRVISLGSRLGCIAKGAVGELFPNALDVAVRQAIDDGWRVDHPEAYCRRCGSSIGPGCATQPACPRCLGRPIAWDQAIRLNAYTEPMRQWIVSMKFARGWTWGPWLGRQLAEVIRPIADRSPPPVVCPVPMHWTRRLYRGYNQAELIASSLARQLGWARASLLRRVRYTQPQISVPPSQRPANIRRSIAMADLSLEGWDVWLVDDVKTTGSTLSACARLLRRAGAKKVYIAVAAVADPQGADFKLLPQTPRRRVPTRVNAVPASRAFSKWV